MVTNELINYVKDQLALGVPKEKIVSDLSTQGGWSPENIQEAFSSLESTTSTLSGIATEQPLLGNKIWSKRIPGSNKIAMVVSLILFLVVDLYILITLPELLVFWLAMLAVMVIFCAFYYYENNKLAPKFLYSQSKLDYWILTLAGLRNLVFILNFIPFIQLLGGAALIFGGIPYLIVYFILIHLRSKVV